jgi:hypothetical protein
MVRLTDGSEFGTAIFSDSYDNLGDTKWHRQLAKQWRVSSGRPMWGGGTI